LFPFLGDAPTQVELGEIEGVLEGHPSVAAAVCNVQSSTIVAFIVPSEAVIVGAVRSHRVITSTKEAESALLVGEAEAESALPSELVDELRQWMAALL
jgi:hypothetical protein